MKLYVIGKFPKLIGRTTQILRDLYKKLVLEPTQVAESSSFI